MTAPRDRLRVVVAIAAAIAAGRAAAGVPAGPAAARARWFADRPVAWEEHDDGAVAALPALNVLQDLEVTLAVRDGVANEIDRFLALEGQSPALDVNALDEIPCSTWFCARNHRRPMTPEEITAGPPAEAPRLPFRITKGKDQGVASGFQVADAAGRKFMLKMSPAGHLGMIEAAEVIGNRVFHAAGYNVPGAFLVDLRPDQLTIDPRATVALFGVETRPLTEAEVRSMLARAAHHPDGGLRALAVPWIEGRVMGSFDMMGTRAGDPNDRLPHQHRRSLRASRVLFSWLSVLDAGPINTMDTFVEESGRHFVRHYFFDFGCAFGSATNDLQGVHDDGEYAIEVGRTLGAFASLGLYHRPFQSRRDEWRRLVGNYPAIGYYPAETFDPDDFRTNRKNSAFVRMTERDGYWGAKVVTSFSDAQIDALAAMARLPAPEAAYLAHALRVRRDILGRRYLRALAAVENPRMGADGATVCFDDSGHRARVRRRDRDPLRGRGRRRLRRPDRDVRRTQHRRARLRADRRGRAWNRLSRRRREDKARRRRRTRPGAADEGVAHPSALARRRATLRGGRPREGRVIR